MNIQFTINSDLPSLYDPLEYMLDMPSKRFRPMLCELTANMLGGSNTEVQKLSSALEVFHNFTLMHDDVMDHAPLRRGLPTVHEKWGVSQAILSGDVMLIKAYELISGLTDSKMVGNALKWFNKVSIEVCEGQQLDMDFEGRSLVNYKQYIEMIRLKTAVLIGLSMAFAGIGTGKSEHVIQELYILGEKIGLLFQIQDDYLDCFGDPKTFGKQIGGDILEGKKSIVYLKALEIIKDPEQLKNSYTEKESKDKVKKVMKLYEQCGVQKIVQTMMQDHYKNILLAIQNASLFNETLPLESLIEKLYKRSH